MKLKTMIGAALAAATLGATVLAGTAAADGSNPGTVGTGWDDVNDQIVGGGSDTTYPWHQLAERIYNQAGGCRVVTSSGSANKGKCLTGASQDQTDYSGNWDHDYAVSAYPTGSSAGVRELTATPAVPGGLYNYARSSRGPKTDGSEAGTTFWGVGKDAIAVVTFPGRASANLTTQEVKDIWSCTKTDWSQVGGGAFGSGPIVPIGMNPDSGTKGTFDSFLGFDANAGACVAKLSNGQYPFENDVKQLDTVSWPSGTGKANAIWWMSAASWKSYSFKRVDAQLNTVNNRSPINVAQVAGNLYPITRFIYHVTRTADATPGTGGNVTGATSGKPGAVREFTEFLCKPAAQHGQNEYSGLSNATELANAYGATGFLAVPSLETTNGGICRVVFGV